MTSPAARYWQKLKQVKIIDERHSTDLKNELWQQIIN